MTLQGKQPEVESRWSDSFYRVAKFYLTCFILAMAFYCFTRLAEKEAAEGMNQAIRFEERLRAEEQMRAMHAKEEKYG